MESISTPAIKTLPTAAFPKKVGGKPFTEFGPRCPEHGMSAWLEFDGVPGRSEFRFNGHLPDGTPWLERFVTIEEMRKTPKQIVKYEGMHLGKWLLRKISLGRVVLVEPKKEPAEGQAPAAPAKTEKVARRRNQRELGILGRQAYGC